MNNISPVSLGWISRFLGGVVYLCVWLSLAQAKSLVNLEVIKRDGYGSIPLKDSAANEFVVQGTINGRAVRLILDTGAASKNIILTNAFAVYLKTATHPIKEPGVGITGKLIENLKEGKVESLVFGNVQINNTTIDFGSFEHLARRKAGGIFIAEDFTGSQRNRNDADGFLGLGFLDRCAAIIDLANKRLYLKPPGAGKTLNLSPALKAVGFAEAGLQLTSLGLLVDVSINDVSTKMIIDTGAAGSLLDSRFAAQARLKSYGATGARMIDAAGAETTFSWIDPTSLKVGGVEAPRTRLVVQPASFYQTSGGKVAGLLGMDFIGQSWGIIDFAQHKLYFALVK